MAHGPPHWQHAQRAGDTAEGLGLGLRLRSYGDRLKCYDVPWYSYT